MPPTTPDVICPTCGHIQPKLFRYPVPPDMKIYWRDLQYIERKLMAAVWLDHLRQPYREWRPMFMAEFGHMKYRTVCNAIRRLKTCGWLHHVRRGVYRVSDAALAQMSWLPPNLTQTKIIDAQEPDTEDMIK